MNSKYYTGHNCGECCTCDNKDLSNLRRSLMVNSLTSPQLLGRAMTVRGSEPEKAGLRNESELNSQCTKNRSKR